MSAKWTLVRLVLVIAALVAGFFGSRALSASPPVTPQPWASVSTEDDEIAALRSLDAEGASVQAQLERLNGQRAAAYEAIYGQARGRLHLPLKHPIIWNGKTGKLEIAPVSTETKK